MERALLQLQDQTTDLIVADLTMCADENGGYSNSLGRFLRQCYRILRADRHMYLGSDPLEAPAIAQIARATFSVKGILVSTGEISRETDHGQMMFILFASKGRRPIRRRDLPDIVPKSLRAAPNRTTSFTPTLVRYLLTASCQPGDVVCDVSPSARITRRAAAASQLGFVPRRRRTHLPPMSASASGTDDEFPCRADGRPG